MSKDKETDVKVLPHNYDGIQELDNPLPSWWLFTFYITIVFGIFYYGYYEFFGGPTSDQYLARSLDEIQEKKKIEAENVEKQPTLTFAEIIGDKDKVKIGQEHFKTKCAACHGQLGEGIIGPNLTDNFWIYSKGDMEGVLKAIREGYLNKGMPPWKDVITPKEQPYLAAYVLTLKGTNPPNGKDAQGEEVK